MNMLSLFSTRSDTSGFRLNYLEVYNWGTFDDEIIRIEPKGNNSLLTGANGSGKTTFIDALLTLLVPQKKDRFYNQSSGSEKKGDRTEESYVLGAYGTILKEGASSATAQRLRNKDTYSILLASFGNEDQKTVTLFQLRWFSGNEMRRSYGIAHIPLTIENHFPKFDDKNLWKYRLEQEFNNNTQKKRVEFFDDYPTRYAKRLVAVLGMKSLKALKLFNQTVGIKVLEDLDGFIRVNMLEDKKPEATYVELRNSFVTLSSAKNKIDKTQEQLKQLEPINNLAEKLKEKTGRKEKLIHSRDLAVLWFSKKGKELFDTEKDNLEGEKEKVETQLKELDDQEEILREDLNEINNQIKNDEISTQIDKLTKNVKELEIKKSQRQTKLDSYNTFARKLTLEENPNESAFDENKDNAIKRAEETDDERTQKIEGKTAVEIEIAENKKAIDDVVETIETLRKNDNNISGRVASIREDILTATGASKKEIPFVGELIKVKDEQLKWQSSIEKVLHSFALRLIVPEKYYKKVNTYVNETNLRGKITYLRHTDSLLSGFNTSFQDDDKLISKLEFKKDSPYADFIEDNIVSRYNYLCVEDLNAFAKAEKAITINGLIKRGKGNHEKDDRAKINSRNNYVLGWDNKAKINALNDSYTELRENGDKLLEDKKQIDADIKKLADLNKNYNAFLASFEDYDLINWKKYARDIQELNDTIKELEEGNDTAKTLRKRKKSLEDKIAENKAEKKPKSERIFNINRILGEIQGELITFESQLKILSDNSIDISDFDAENQLLSNLSYQNFKQVRSTFQQDNQNDLKKVEESIYKTRDKLTPRISKFKNPDKDTLERFPDWGSDVSELTSNLDHLYQYQDLYKRLKNDDLPSFQSKFDTYLEDTIIDKVGAFNFFFEKWIEEIKKTIKTLNASLQAIDFEVAPRSTYIQLSDRMALSEQADDFRKLLHEALPDVTQITSTESKRIHFENYISPLIEQLDDEKWRKQALDVRYWFQYRAEEFVREDDHKIATFESMSHRSGGQKAQLTYTILGAAIAYQFNLTSQGLEANSFRFVAIDEAFKAQDQDKSEYLLKLCEQLHLQVLVVTPSDNIEIVEPYISFVHFTEIENGKKSSLYDMPIEQFQKESEKYLMTN
ncbi:MAG: ATP-binding protein [Allomuricauda sp.]